MRTSTRSLVAASAFFCSCIARFASADPAPPINDNCEHRVEIGPGTICTDNIGASTDGPSCAPIGSDIWFNYTAEFTGTVVVKTCQGSGSSGASNCCLANGGAGCGDPECQAAVCAIDPFCCDISWDGICAGEASDLCGELCVVCETDFDTVLHAYDGCNCQEIIALPSNCCSTHSTPGCDDPACQNAVCANEPHCCQVGWNAACEHEAEDVCGDLCGDPVLDCNDDTCGLQSMLAFPVVFGDCYKIQAGGFNGATGHLALTIEKPNCDNGIIVTGEPCDDGNACTAGDSCQDGACLSGAPVDCNDANSCTADACDPGTGCVYTSVECNDDDPCTTDSCDPASGCVFTPQCTGDVGCAAGEVCAAGCCVSAAIAYALDIREGQCPNKFKITTGGGDTKVYIAGGVGSDVNLIDLSSIHLRLCGGSESILPIKSPRIKDKVTPLFTQCGNCTCHKKKKDYVDDVEIKFKRSQVSSLIDDCVIKGTLIDIEVHGTLLDGALFTAHDCVLVDRP